MFPKETKVLVVDDMMTMRKIVKKCLVENGLTNVIEADDGETAWAAIEKAIAENTPVQLILSDWNMPKMKGIDLLKKVRAHATMGKTPFLLITAESEGHQVKEAVTAGVSSYIIKPFTAETVLGKLKAVFDATNKK